MSIPSSLTPLFNSGSSGGLQISRSIRLNSADSAYFSRTPAVAGNRRTWTWSGWVKRSAISFSAEQHIWGVTGTTDDTYGEMFFGTGDTLRFGAGYTTVGGITTTRVFRDPGAWFHLVLAFDATQATAANKIRLYVNGVEETTFSSDTRSSLANQDWGYNNNVAHYMGRQPNSNIRQFNGYLANIHFIDGQQLTPSSFTETDATTGQLIPKTYTGSYGTNGFNLLFADNSSNTASTLGKDYSGLGNNWTPNNLSVTAGAGNDSLVDSPTNYGTDTGVGGEVRGNYATLNPLALSGSATISDGNLRFVANGAAYANTKSSIGAVSGKWYAELNVITRCNSSDNQEFGIFDGVGNPRLYATYNNTTYTMVNGSSNTSTGVTSNNGDVMQVAYDADSGKVWLGANGTWFGSGNPSTGSNPYVTVTANTLFFFFTQHYGTIGVSAYNFGQRAFAYTAPSGFKVLCTQNLPASLVTKSNTVMDVVTYTGNGSTQTISGLGFSPDLVWLKVRSNVVGHGLFDQVRGAGKALYSHATNAEYDYGTTSSGELYQFNSDGFNLGSFGVWNVNNQTSVAWAWDAGTSTVSNTAGSITSQVRANATAGFSVVTYTGTGANATVGHGLGVAPKFFIIKRRDISASWIAWHTGIGANDILRLESTNAKQTISGFWQGTNPSSTILYLDADGTVNGSGGTLVAYCFAPVVGYSNGFSYTGNGSADGVFQFLGFRPRLIMLKRSDSTSNWTLLDTSREGYNVDNDPLYPNTTDVEGTADLVDITSNGFKLRTTDASVNASAGTYIGFAWAEMPFNYSRAR